MVEVDGGITIDRPPDEVIHLVANEPRYTADGLAERITEGPIGVGTSFRAGTTGRAQVIPMTIEVTDFDPPRL
jgi:hypothetical protein